MTPRPASAVPKPAGDFRHTDRHRVLAALRVPDTGPASGPPGVGVAVLDTGIDENPLLAPRIREVWPPRRGEPVPGHGTECAYSIVSICPDCELFDYAVFGPRHPDKDAGAEPGRRGVAARLADAQAALAHARRRFRRNGTPRIVLCAFAEYAPPCAAADAPHPRAGAYWNDPDHPFTREVVAATKEGMIVVFGAGNCGRPGAGHRCGSNFTGPGRSILGANGHDAVISVGACDFDGARQPYSSQGPSVLRARKPDVVCVSEFRGLWDPHGGTSNAAALVAGAIAWLCQNVRADLSPREISRALRLTARKPAGSSPGWDRDLGYGLIDVAAAATLLRWQCRYGPVFRALAGAVIEARLRMLDIAGLGGGRRQCH